MSGMEIAGLVITLVELGRRIALAVKDVSDQIYIMCVAICSFDQAKDLPETMKDYIKNIESHLAMIKQLADQLDGSNHLFTASLKQLPE
jgi:hypothetical protein